MPLKGTVGLGETDHDSVLQNRIVIDMDELIKRVDPTSPPSPFW